MGSGGNTRSSVAAAHPCHADGGGDALPLPYGGAARGRGGAVPGGEGDPGRAPGILLHRGGKRLCASERLFSVGKGLFLPAAGRLWLQILFYTLLIPPVLALFGRLSWREALDPYHLWNCLFPVESGHYWFATAYVVMLLFSPALNAAVRALSRRQLKAVILCLLAFFCFGKSLSVLPFGTDRYGYDFGWFCCLYLIAAYLRKYGSTFLYGKKRGGALYLISCAGVAALSLLCLYLCGRTGALEYYASVPFHYNFLLCLTGALGLFAFFSGLRIPENGLAQAARRISPAVFGVYLIHEHADVSAGWALWIAGEASEHFGGYLIQLTESVLLLFVLGVCVDLVRARLFDVLERLLVRTRPGACLDRLIGELDRLMKE